MRARENKSQISQQQKNTSHMKCLEFYLYFHSFVKFNIYFLRLQWEIVFGVITSN